MATDQHDASIAIEGTTSVSGDSLSSEGVSEEVSSNRDAKNDSNLVIDKIPNEKHIYRQDVVRRRDGSMVGVVTEVAGDSDSDSDSDITDDSDESDEDDKGEEEGEEEEDEVCDEVKEEEGDGVREEVKEEDNVENDGDDGDGNESSDDNRSS